MKTQILLTIEHEAPIPDLLDKIAGRAYTLTGVDDVTVGNYEAVKPKELYETKHGYLVTA